MLTFRKTQPFCRKIVSHGGRGDGQTTARPVPLLFFKKAVDMAVVAAIGVTVGFAILRGAVRRVAIRSGRKKE